MCSDLRVASTTLQRFRMRSLLGMKGRGTIRENWIRSPVSDMVQREVKPRFIMAAQVCGMLLETNLRWRDSIVIGILYMHNAHDLSSAVWSVLGTESWKK